MPFWVKHFTERFEPAFPVSLLAAMVGMQALESCCLQEDQVLLLVALRVLLGPGFFYRQVRCVALRLQEERRKQECTQGSAQ